MPSNSRTHNNTMPCAVRATKGPSTSVLTETKEEASHDEPSAHEESEPEQEVSIKHPHPNAHDQSTLICICLTLKVQKWTGWSMMHYTTNSSSGNSNVRVLFTWTPRN